MDESARLRTSRTLVAYLVSVATAVTATAVTWLATAERVGHGSLFFAAVMLSAGYGGLGPGLMATAISSFSSAYIFFYPPGSLLIGMDDIVRLAVFIAVAVLISSLHTRTQWSEQAALRAHEEALAANRAKDRFLALVTHELRNPLNPVLTIAALWEHDAALPPEAREDMATVRRNIELESRLIDDLLDLSRITSGKLELRRQRVDLAGVVSDALAVCAANAEEKKLVLDVEAPPQVLMVDGDPIRLRQVVWNLLNNAVKFTPAGGRITVKAAASPSSDTVELAVSDSGIGMERAMLARVFEAFEQCGADVTHRYGGLGLGLAIAKSLTEAHGGSVTAHSDGPDRGSTFTVRLPASPPAAERLSDDGSAPKRPGAGAQGVVPPGVVHRTVSDAGEPESLSPL